MFQGRKKKKSSFSPFLFYSRSSTPLTNRSTREPPAKKTRSVPSRLSSIKADLLQRVYGDRQPGSATDGYHYPACHRYALRYPTFGNRSKMQLKHPSVAKKEEKIKPFAIIHSARQSVFWWNFKNRLVNPTQQNLLHGYMSLSPWIKFGLFRNRSYNSCM